MKRRNHGVRKRCGCLPKQWPKCPHPWHFNFQWKGVDYRLSLERERGRRIETKGEAEAIAEQLRLDIRAGKFRGQVPEVPGATAAAPATSREPELTFAAFAEIWKERRGSSSCVRVTTTTGCGRSPHSLSRPRAAPWVTSP